MEGDRGEKFAVELSLRCKKRENFVTIKGEAVFMTQCLKFNPETNCGRGFQLPLTAISGVTERGFFGYFFPWPRNPSPLCSLIAVIYTHMFEAIGVYSSPRDFIPRLRQAMNDATPRQAPQARLGQSRRLRSEYTRMDLTSGKWKEIQNVKEDGTVICPTYPSHIVVPQSVELETVESAAAYRKAGRMIAVVFRANQTHNNVHPVIARASQPQAGLTGAQSNPDHEILTQIRQAVASGWHPLVIADCRSLSAGHGNRLKGGGVESESNHVTVVHLDIANIHAMRKSYQELQRVCFESRWKRQNNQDLHTMITNTQWLYHIASVLEGVRKVVKYIEDGYSVLIHCSDGWDRTSQLSALAQLCLDPHYRTIEGFIALVEKEWLRFGHKFYERCFGEENERSPIFLQFLDCVYQLIRRSPRAFEFGEDVLVLMYHELYSVYFGTFQGDCDGFREVNDDSGLWAVLRRHVHKDFDHKLRGGLDLLRDGPVSLWERVYCPPHEDHAHTGPQGVCCFPDLLQCQLGSASSPDPETCERDLRGRNGAPVVKGCDMALPDSCGAAEASSHGELSEGGQTETPLTRTQRQDGTDVPSTALPEVPHEGNDTFHNHTADPFQSHPADPLKTSSDMPAVSLPLTEAEARAIDGVQQRQRPHWAGHSLSTHILIVIVLALALWLRYLHAELYYRLV